VGHMLLFLLRSDKYLYTTPRSPPLGHEPYLLGIAGRMWGYPTAILGDAAAEIVCVASSRPIALCLPDVQRICEKSSLDCSDSR
jgi:hypothetical protein